MLIHLHKLTGFPIPVSRESLSLDSPSRPTTPTISLTPPIFLRLFIKSVSASSPNFLLHLSPFQSSPILTKSLVYYPIFPSLSPALYCGLFFSLLHFHQFYFSALPYTASLPLLSTETWGQAGLVPPKQVRSVGDLLAPPSLLTCNSSCRHFGSY